MTLQNRIGRKPVHSQNTGELQVVELAPAEKLHGVGFLRVSIQIRILTAELFLNIPRRFDGDRHALGVACIGSRPRFALPFAPLTAAALRGHTEPQPLVELFRAVAQRGDGAAMLKILIAGAVLAPVCEEFLFRGFFYAVGKRYLGPLASGFITALLFAAIHQSLSAFAGLFVLAACLTLAYERTGSLLVPIGMHALYNFTSLLFIYLMARGTIPSP